MDRVIDNILLKKEKVINSEAFPKYISIIKSSYELTQRSEKQLALKELSLNLKIKEKKMTENNFMKENVFRNYLLVCSLNGSEFVINSFRKQ